MEEQKIQTIKLYDDASYETEFQAKILNVEQEEERIIVVLDQTLFFPEEGGQSPDTGVLGGYPVLDVQIKDGKITHYIGKKPVEKELSDGTIVAVNGEEIENGNTVHGKIDWSVRFSNMQNHSGEHVLSGLIHDRFGFDNVGFHLSPQTVTMDMNGTISQKQVEEIERAANQAVYDNVEISAVYMQKQELADLNYRSKIDLEGPVRIVTIPGYDVCACCAPHVSRTGEIGQIKILKAENYKGGIRLTIACGDRALADAKVKQDCLGEICQYLSANPDNVMDEIKRLQKETVSLKSQIVELKTQAMQEKVKAIEVQDNMCIFEPAMDANIQRNYVNMLLDKCNGICAVFSGSDSEGYRYLIASKEKDTRAVNQILKDTFAAKGGGKPQMVQGSVNGSEEEIRAALEKEL